MGLSNDLISQFVKTVNTDSKKQTETTVYGTIKISDGKTYVTLDGSTMDTPVSSTAAVKNGDRVTVMIKDHSAIITGNLSAPSINKDSEIDNGDGTTTKISEFGIVVADKVNTDQLEAVKGDIDDLTTKNLEVSEQLTAAKADIKDLEAENATIKGTVEAHEGKFDQVDATFVNVSGQLTAANAKIETLEATDADFRAVEADYGDFKTATVDNLSVANGKIDDLEINKADVTWANIDFANVDVAKLGEFFATSGIIQDIITENGTVTGELVGVTIKGDLIEGNTIVADKLVIKGDDGLYYKLNTEAVTEESRADAYVKSSEVIAAVDGTLLEDITTTTGEAVYSYFSEDNALRYYCLVDGVYYTVNIETGAVEVKQTEYNSLDGRIITAKSIAAEKIAVSDLVAFGATIGGFNIRGRKVDDETGEVIRGAIYSGTKAAVDSTNPGSYLDDEGQFAFGDSASYIKYYRVLDEDGNEILDESGKPVYRLVISADSVIFGASGSLASELEDLANNVKIGTYTNPDTGDSKPSVELSEEDGDDKVLLTNENIVFAEGETERTKLTKDSITTDTIIINKEIRQGPLVWGFRANGNYALMWKGGS